MPAASQIELQQARQKVRACGIVEVWISDSELKGFCQEGVLELHAELGVVNAIDVSEINLDARIGQVTLLAEGYRLICEGIIAWIVFHQIAPVIRIDGQNGSGAEDVYEARRYVNRAHQLTLVLTERLLVELVRNLKFVARQKQVQMKRVLGIQLVVEAIKDIRGRAATMQHSKLRRIQKATRPFVVERNEVSDTCRAVSQRGLLARRPERSILRV